MSDVVTLERRDVVAIVTVNNPPVNALSAAVRRGIAENIKSAAADPQIQAIVLTCAGRTFIAGADITEFGKPPQPPGLGEVISDIENCPKPVVAAIHGTALGGGLEVALGCHFRVATKDAKMGLPEVKLGLIPGYGGTQRLPRLVSQSAALKLLLTGAIIPAQEALRIGLVDEVVAPEHLLERGRELAGQIAAMAPLAVEACLEAVQKGADRSLDAALSIESSIFGRLAGTQDKAEGTRAFLEKRPPVWTGR